VRAPNWTPKRHHMTTSARQNGISEGAGPCQGVREGVVLRGLVVRGAGCGHRARAVEATRSDGSLCWVVGLFSSRRREVRTRVPSGCEGGQARLPRHLFAHWRAHGAVRPRPSGAQSLTSAAPRLREPCRSASWGAALAPVGGPIRQDVARASFRQTSARPRATPVAGADPRSTSAHRTRAPNEHTDRPSVLRSRAPNASAERHRKEPASAHIPALRCPRSQPERVLRVPR